MPPGLIYPSAWKGNSQTLDFPLRRSRKLAARSPSQSGVPSFLDQGPVGALQPPRPVFEGVQDVSPIGVMDDVGYGPGAEDEVGAGRARTVHHLVGDRHPRWPAGASPGRSVWGPSSSITVASPETT